MSIPWFLLTLLPSAVALALVVDADSWMRILGLEHWVLRRCLMAFTPLIVQTSLLLTIDLASKRRRKENGL